MNSFKFNVLERHFPFDLAFCIHDRGMAIIDSKHSMLNRISGTCCRYTMNCHRE